VIEPADLWDEAEQPRELEAATDLPDNMVAASFERLSYQKAKNALLHRFNTAYLSQALRVSGGNVTAAARACGMERQAFQRLLRRQNIDSRSFRDG